MDPESAAHESAARRSTALASAGPRPAALVSAVSSPAPFSPAVTNPVASSPVATSLAVPLPADRSPTCTTPVVGAFPLATRIHGGPGSYEAGGAEGTWFIDLKNTTAHPCGNIHPVVVLVDEKRVLTVTQPRLEFFEGARPHPVTFERTDQDELVGVFDDGFPGFTVAPGRTLTVKVRLTVAAGTVPDAVVANAAIVQRRGADGDWVGQSNDYRFQVVVDAGNGDGNASDGNESEGNASEGNGDGTGSGDGTENGDGNLSGDGNTSGDGDTSSDDSNAGDGSASPAPTGSPLPREDGAEELARTGPRAPHGLGAVFGTLLLVVGGVLLAAAGPLLHRNRR
ncbi:hypothetical protein SAVERM_5213 [Streptomyces avermitilis MA-4680 = NBRC 14893]|uniref:Gram-positive cocci surface proteins LPxTG domain-containing protein n=1 Tax=Streptomyces avermitilis (strain ATCC 31267 / DSM 46492 / JCM 5070 / NBRC 14893 / NCIMB 12804 / NRRL 8165 / MA-4680) TaxID=227882 RepID=Q82CX5_STRAW|nr:hypothetical protein SAVERM_5213 [Streptomyces avermitilis MA-4680 = NBRC 14893]